MDQKKEKRIVLAIRLVTVGWLVAMTTLTVLIIEGVI